MDAYNCLQLPAKDAKFWLWVFSASTRNYWKLIKIEKNVKSKKMIVSVREDEGLLTYFYLCSVNLQFEVTNHTFSKLTCVSFIQIVCCMIWDLFLGMCMTFYSSKFKKFEAQKSLLHIQPNSNFLISCAKIAPGVCASYSRKYIKHREKNANVQQQCKMIIYGKPAVKF